MTRHIHRHVLPAALLAATISLAACATAPEGPRYDSSGGSAREPATQTVAILEPSLQRPLNRLLEQARSQMEAGKTDQAAATLERAVRLAPREPLPWQRLASVRLAQGNAAQAESLALKSVQLGGSGSALGREGWRIVAEARRQLGDMAGAEQADRQAGAP